LRQNQSEVLDVRSGGSAVITARRIHHPIRYWILLPLLALAACASNPGGNPDELDTRLSGPCQRLVVTWSIQTKILDGLIGGAFRARYEGGDSYGQLRLSVMQCRQSSNARSRDSALLFAYLSVSADVSSVPLRVTGITADRWFALSNIIVNEAAYPLFSRLGYKAESADIKFVAEQDNSHTTLDIELSFSEGSIVITSLAEGTAESFEAPIAHIERRLGAGAVFFGLELAKRRITATSVFVEGNTPLTGLGATEVPSTSYFDTDITADRYFWQILLSD